MSKRIVSVGVLLTMSISAHPLTGAAASESALFLPAMTAERISVRQKRQARQATREAANEGLSDAVRQPELRSAAPRYARLALDRSGSKVLSIVFDESEGTGKGYDLLYADMNFNGVFEQAEKFKAKAREREGKVISNSFPAIRLSVAYNEGVGDQARWNIAFTYETPNGGSRVPTSAWISQRPPLSVGRFHLAASVSMRRDATRWRYFLYGAITPSGTLRTASVWRIGDLKLELISGPDANGGRLGIALLLKAVEKELASYRGGLPARARVEIKDPNGRVVHKVEDALDKFGFG